MSSYTEHAKREFVALGYDLNDKEDGPNKWIMENILELLKVFGAQGHSGTSAPYCINMFRKLAAFEPLSPLRGDAVEWVEVSDNVWQNNRCSHVFKEKDGVAYDTQGRIFKERNGACFANRDSRVNVEFPYTPKTEYADAPE